MKKRSVFLALTAASAIALSACAGTANSGSNDATTSGELQSVPGFDAESKTITVGSMVPVSGIWEGARANVYGQEAYFHQATQPGGPLEGFTVEVKNYDTEYDPSVAVPLYNSTKNEVLMYSMVLGSGVNKALHQQYVSDDILAVAASTESESLRDPNMLSAGPLYGTYVASGIEYMADEGGNGDGVFCALIQDDHLGEQVKDGFDFATDELGLEVGVVANFPIDNPDFTPQVSQMRQANCDVVVVGGAGSVLQNAAVKAVALNFEPQWLAPNFAYNDQIATGPASEHLKENALFLLTGTEWGDQTVEGQKNLEEGLAAVAPNEEPVANAYQTGYLNAAITAHVIEKGIESGDLSRENLLRIAESELGTIDDQGLSGGDIVFGSDLEDRMPNSIISLFRVSEDSPTGLVLHEKYYDSEAAANYNIETMSQQ